MENGRYGSGFTLSETIDSIGDRAFANVYVNVRIDGTLPPSIKLWMYPSTKLRTGKGRELLQQTVLPLATSTKLRTGKGGARGG